MANNCYNYITIKGDKSEIKDFYELLKLDKTKGQDNGNDIFENLKYLFGDHKNNAKWFEIDLHEFDENEITISGDSAWCPSLELFTKISEKYQSFKIRYEYEEIGCDFAGYANIIKGDCEDNQDTYWKGKILNSGEAEALDQVLSNELECFESEKELIKSDMYAAFNYENQQTILEGFLTIYK